MPNETHAPADHEDGLDRAEPTEPRTRWTEAKRLEALAEAKAEERAATVENLNARIRSCDRNIDRLEAQAKAEEHTLGTLREILDEVENPAPPDGSGS